MAFIKITELFSVSCEGTPYPNEIKEVKLPDLKRKLDPYRAGGMDSPVPTDLGGEALECELTFGGSVTPAQITKDWTSKKVMGKTWTIRGYHRDQETGVGTGIEIVIRGRHNIDNPSMKPGEAGESKVKLSLAYYKYIEDGKTLVEIEPLAHKHIVDGDDKLADARNFIGL